MRLIIYIILFSVLASTQLVFATPASHENTESRALFQKVFADWTYAFNHQNTDGACRLFAPDVIATYRGFPPRNYAKICEGFNKIFTDSSRRYQYQFKLGPIYRSTNLAAVRITWFLTIVDAHGKKLAFARDEGLDILKKQPTGEWKIIHYLAYGV